MRAETIGAAAVVLLAGGLLLLVAVSVAGKTPGRGARVGLVPLANRFASGDLAPAEPRGGLNVSENRGQYQGRARYLIMAGDTLLAIYDRDLRIFVMSSRAQDIGTPGPEATGQPEGESAGGMYGIVITFPSAGGRLLAEGYRPRTTSVSYSVGSDPREWQKDVPVWAAARIRSVAPGFDLEIEGDDGGWRWSLVEQDLGWRDRIGPVWSSGPVQFIMKVEDASRVAITDGMILAETDRVDLRMPLPTVQSSSGQSAPGLPNPQVRADEIVVPLKSEEGASPLR